MLLARRLTKEWQVGDGREEALAQYVTSHAAHGDLDDVIRAIDEFCYSRSFMINVGDEKGEILDAAVRRAAPQQALELGTYCGYSGLRIARAMPEGGRLASIELNPANAEIARRIWDHARVGDRLAVLVGTLGDSGATVERLTVSGRDPWTSCSSTTPRTPTSPTSSESSTVDGFTQARSWSRTTSSFPARPNTATICAPRRAIPGVRSSTRRMPSTRRF